MQNFTVTRKNDGSTFSYDGNERLHSINDAPAVAFCDGTRIWFDHGVRHRNDAPAFIRDDGYAVYYNRGVKVREDFSNMMYINK